MPSYCTKAPTSHKLEPAGQVVEVRQAVRAISSHSKIQRTRIWSPALRYIRLDVACSGTGEDAARRQRRNCNTRPDRSMERPNRNLLVSSTHRPTLDLPMQSPPKSSCSHSTMCILHGIARVRTSTCWLYDKANQSTGAVPDEVRSKEAPGGFPGSAVWRS